jgi:hypothetical protein
VEVKLKKTLDNRYRRDVSYRLRSLESPGKSLLYLLNRGSSGAHDWGLKKTEFYYHVPAEWSFFEVLLVGKLQDEK